MICLQAPMLAGSRAHAAQLLTQLPTDLSGKVVHLHGQTLIAATASFADEIVRTILVDSNAVRLEISSISDRKFITHLRERATAHQVGARLHVLT